jgi:hypothetical protein
MTRADKILLLVSVVVLTGFAALAASRWDGTYQFKGTLSSNDAGPTQIMTLSPNGEYIKVKCPNDTYIGLSSDAGSYCNNYQCELVNSGTQGEIYYAQSIPSYRYLNAKQLDGGTASCTVWRGQ